MTSNTILVFSQVSFCFDLAKQPYSLTIKMEKSYIEATFQNYRKYKTCTLMKISVLTLDSTFLNKNMCSFLVGVCCCIEVL